MKKTKALIWLTCLLLIMSPVTNVYASSENPSIVVYCGETNDENVAVFAKPSVKSKLLGYLRYGESVSGTLTDDEKWLEVTYGDSTGYILNSKFSVGGLPSRTFTMPANSGYKSFMYSSSIKSWDPAKVKKKAKIGKYGILTVNDRFCVAIGTKANVQDGQYFDVILKNGTVIPCIKCDTKDNRDTLANNMITRDNGCCLEFVVDKAQLNSKAKGRGDISFVCDAWNSPVAKLEIYNYNVLR